MQFHKPVVSLAAVAAVVIAPSAGLLTLAAPAQASVAGAKAAVIREVKADRYRVLTSSLTCRTLTSRRYACRFSYSDNGRGSSWGIRRAKATVRQSGRNYQVTWRDA